ncbi:DUF559 domain-containing protein [Humibacter sp. RRB41]|uniref:DUF559 domain-containing protein n=1 Tax=Humibacter sp. RRB41 TaxID=2919946 RepID=UPI001FAA607F|nr:DUF559 domain-containing protein [Humibacter sp. RRB41]
MGAERGLPPELGGTFSVARALRMGISYERLRAADLARPFHGVRRPTGEAYSDDDIDPYERQRRSRIVRAREYLPRMHPDHFFSHETAVSIYRGPLPLTFTELNDLVLGAELGLHVSAVGPVALPRTAGVVRHRAHSGVVVTKRDGLRVTSAASTWASLGALSLPDSIALGDFFCRAWRTGFGRPNAGRPPLATVADLRAALATGRRRGAPTLRAAIELIREDSWSPRESRVRYELVSAGLPEPELNVDVFDESGRFQGCVDMLYRRQRVIVEYHGMLHRDTWAADVERIAAFRDAGWTVIEVTTTLLANPTELVRRVSKALARR